MYLILADFPEKLSHSFTNKPWCLLFQTLVSEPESEIVDVSKLRNPPGRKSWRKINWRVHIWIFGLQRIKNPQNVRFYFEHLQGWSEQCQGFLIYWAVCWQIVGWLWWADMDSAAKHLVVVSVLLPRCYLAVRTRSSENHLNLNENQLFSDTITTTTNIRQWGVWGQWLCSSHF